MVYAIANSHKLNQNEKRERNENSLFMRVKDKHVCFFLHPALTQTRAILDLIMHVHMERERTRECELELENSNLKTLFYKDYS